MTRAAPCSCGLDAVQCAGGGNGSTHDDRVIALAESCQWPRGWKADRVHRMLAEAERIRAKRIEHATISLGPDGCQCGPCGQWLAGEGEQFRSGALSFVTCGRADCEAEARRALTSGLVIARMKWRGLNG